MKTVISHFYNEEYLLPFWLKHHKQFFDHGIMINYHSTDRSVEIIKEICPSWEIVDSRNAFFQSADIDREVEDYEKNIEGWRVCLNTTEFLVGNYSTLDEVYTLDNSQLFLANYVFFDEHLTELNKNESLVTQLKFGYREDLPSAQHLHQCSRSFRSIHNFSISYPRQGGRHWFPPKIPLKDLAIFYVGYLTGIKEIVERKIQIPAKVCRKEYRTLVPGHPSTLDQRMLDHLTRTFVKPRCVDMTEELAYILSF